MTHFKLIHQLERDIRNQVLIDSLKRLNRKQRTMVYLRRHALPIAAKFFPVLAPIAKGVSAIVAFPLHALHSAETEFHKLAADAASVKAQAVQVALEAEKAAHASTAATLVKVALTPDLPANTITTP